MEKFKDKSVFLKIKILLVISNESKKNNRLFGNDMFSFSNSINNNKTTEGENGFKLKPLEMNVHKLICQKLKKKNEYISNNKQLIFEFYEIMDDSNKKELKKNKYRKTILSYKYIKDINPDYINLILALGKKNYLNKLFPKENIQTNKIKTKLIQFLGKKKVDKPKEDKNSKEDSNQINNLKNENIINEKYDNGLEAEIISEENEELVKLFESQFLKSI